MTDGDRGAETAFWGDAAGPQALQRYRTLVNTIDEGIYQLDPDGQFVAVNDVIVDMTGYQREELLGAPVSKLFEQDAASRIEQEIERLQARGAERSESLELSVETASGETLQWELRLSLIFEDGELRGRIGIARDITERKRRERELEESERRYRALVENVPNGAVGLVDEEMQYVTVGGNPQTNDYRSATEMEGATVGEGLSQALAEEVVPRYRAALDGEEVTDPDVIEIEVFDGKRRTVLNHGMPVRNADGEVTRAVVTLTDITERKEYQRKLEESNERLEQFAYAASHDLQEPLRMVSSYLQLIEERYGDQLDEDGQEFIAFAVDGAERMQEMINGLLNYSRVGTRGEPFEPVDLEAVYADVCRDLEMQIEETDADITVEPLPTVRGDREQLYQLLQNLLTNAMEYSEEPPKIHISAEREGTKWTIAVQDTGVGIDPDDADRVFDLFQRLHADDDHEGTGIGLALSKRIVERHGGEISVDSEPGEGSTFSFTIPAGGETDE